MKPMGKITQTFAGKEALSELLLELVAERLRQEKKS